MLCIKLMPVFQDSPKPGKQSALISQDVVELLMSGKVGACTIQQNTLVTSHMSYFQKVFCPVRIKARLHYVREKRERDK